MLAITPIFIIFLFQQQWPNSKASNSKSWWARSLYHRRSRWDTCIRRSIMCRESQKVSRGFAWGKHL